MEKIPLELQWKLLERKVESDVVKKIRQDVKMWRCPEPLINPGPRMLEVVGLWTDGYIRLLGKIGDNNLWMRQYGSSGNLDLDPVIFRPPVFAWHCKRRRKNDLYSKVYSEIERTNFEEIRALTMPIGLYPDCLEDVNKSGKRFRRVNTGTCHSYIIEESEFLLKAHAALLGADAIVDFLERNNRINVGTILETVRYVPPYYIGVPVKMDDGED
jgi:hypothetical protein